MAVRIEGLRMSPPKTRSSFAVLMIVVVCIVWTACGGGGSPQSSTPPSSGGQNGVTPSSISLTPSAATLVIGATEQLKATAQFSKNAVQDVTGQVTWSSSDATVVTVQTGQTTPGLVT